MMMCTGTGSKRPGAPGTVEASLRTTRSDGAAEEFFRGIQLYPHIALFTFGYRDYNSRH